MNYRASTILFIFSLHLLFLGEANSQGMPVYDNTNFISLTKSLVESGKQTSELLKTVNFLKEQKENIEKVNEVVKQLKAVKELTRNNHRLFSLVKNDLQQILNSPYIKQDEVVRISDSFNRIIEEAVSEMDYVKEVLSSNNLKMTDADRVGILKDKEQQSKEMVAEIESKARRYREIISFRAMQHKINNINATY